MNGTKRHKDNKQRFKENSALEHPSDQAMQNKRGLANKRLVHVAHLCLGSNIQPEENLRRAVRMLRGAGQVRDISRCYETLAVGRDGKAHPDQPKFLNMAVCLETTMDMGELKTEVIASIERSLGRVRTADKYAPRPIDLDIIVFDGEVIDQHLWERLFIALPFSELLPKLVNPHNGETLRETAERLLVTEQVSPRPVIFP